MNIPSLYQFFRRQVQNGLDRIQLYDHFAVDYVSDLLTRFSRTSALYPYRDDRGRTLEHIIDLRLLQQGSENSHVHNRPRSVAVSRYIGEYTLFMCGLFRERLQARSEFDYYTAHGRSAFGLCASYAVHVEKKHLFQYLSHHFDPISTVLSHIRRPMEMQPDREYSVLTALWRY